MERCFGSQAGNALVIAMISIIALSGASAALLTVSVQRNNEAVMGQNYMKAFYIAEAGVSASMAELTADRDYDSNGKGNASGFFAEGTYSATAADDGSDVWTITSAGTHSGYTRQIEVVASKVTNSPFTKLAFGASGLTMSGNALCDSYDSDSGTYASQKSGSHAKENGHVGSNNNISATGNVCIWGNATPGPGKSVSLTGNAVVHGSTAPAAAQETVAPYTYTPEGTSLGALSVSGNNTRTITNGTYRYSSVSINGNAIIYLGTSATDVITLYVDGSINIAGNAKFQIYNGAKVAIHHGGTGGTGINLAGNSVINASQKPANFMIYSASTQTIQFVGNNDLQGVIYAPNATAKVVGNAQFFGSLIANSVQLTGNGNLHYDEALSRLGGSSTQNYSVRSWREF